LKILFDHNVNRKFRRYLIGHEIQTTRQRGWEQLVNGALLRSAAEAGFDLVLSLDKKSEYEQNLTALPIPVVILDTLSIDLPSLTTFTEPLLKLLNDNLERKLYFVGRTETRIILEPRRKA
jgi:hypothetical protein